MIPKFIINRAIKEASSSDVIRGKVGAVLFTKNGHIITSAHNSAFLGSTRIRTVHAEEFLLQKAFKIKAIERYGSDLNVLVIRWKKGANKLANAKPCIHCDASLKKTPFKVFYSNISGEIVAL